MTPCAAVEIKPIGYFRSPLAEKFGIPRQAGLVPELCGWIELEKEYSAPEALRGLEGFDYLWIIWGFDTECWSPTVRPPRLGGNERVGVFASRSPFRPNPLGLSSVRIGAIEEGRIRVYGADLRDGTAVYDIKPYVEYADSHSGVRSGFVDSTLWKPLEVRLPDSLRSEFYESELTALRGILEQDPRPGYHDDPSRIYGLTFAGRNIRFKVQDNILTVL